MGSGGVLSKGCRQSSVVRRRHCVCVVRRRLCVCVCHAQEALCVSCAGGIVTPSK